MFVRSDDSLSMLFVFFVLYCIVVIVVCYRYGELKMNIYIYQNASGGRAPLGGGRVRFTNSLPAANVRGRERGKEVEKGFGERKGRGKGRKEERRRGINGGLASAY